MLKTITKFSAHKTALTISIVMAAVSLIFLIPMSLFFMVIPSVGGGDAVSEFMPFTMLLVMPAMYLVFGYIMTLAWTYIYNWVSTFTGGIQFTIRDESEEEPTEA